MSGIGSAGDVSPQQLDLDAADSTTIRRTAPIAHGSAVSVVLDDQLDLYNHCRERWRELIGEAGEDVAVPADPSFLPEGDYVWTFRSSNWKAGAQNANGTWKRWYEYHISLRRKTEFKGEEQLSKPPVSLNLSIQPQDERLTYEDGNDYSLPFGEGSRIVVKTTYCERSGEVLDRLFNSLADALASLDGDSEIVSIGDLKSDSARISKLETYSRFDIDKKHSVKRCLDKSENLIDVGGGSEVEVWKQRQEEGWLEARVSSDRWNRLGIDPLEVDRELKCYQAADWTDRSPEDPLKHPKVEASIDSGTAHLSEWDQLLDSLRQLLLVHLEWAGVEDGELIADDFFKPAVQPTVETELPDGRREDLRRYYQRFEATVWKESLKDETTGVYDILSYLAENYGATYEQLEDATGYSRSTLDYHVARLRDDGLLVTVGNPAIIAFDADRLYETVLELIDSKIAPHFSEETLAARRLGREERAEEREERRESGEANGSESSDSDVSDDDSSDDDDSNESTWKYLSDWSGSLLDLEHELESPDHSRGPRDIRVREIG
jgi:DNA-binding transcriptional ArsR family regulator